MSATKRQLSSRNSTGYTGVYKKGERFVAQIYIDRKVKHLGTYDTPKEAALAFDRAVVQHKLPSSRLNFFDRVPIDGEDYDETMKPKKKGRLASTSTSVSGYRGVTKRGNLPRPLLLLVNRNQRRHPDSHVARLNQKE